MTTVERLPVRDVDSIEVRLYARGWNAALDAVAAMAGERALELAAAFGRGHDAGYQSCKALADDRLAQMQADRQQALRWRDALVAGPSEAQVLAAIKAAGYFVTVRSVTDMRAALKASAAVALSDIAGARPAQLTQAQIDAIVYASREADEGPTDLCRRVELAVRAVPAEQVVYREDAPSSAAILGRENGLAVADQRLYGIGFTVNGWRVPAPLVAVFGAAAHPAPAPQAREPLTDEQILKCVQSIGLPKPMGLTRDRGPYEVTEPTYYLQRLVGAIEHAHGITAAPDATS